MATLRKALAIVLCLLIFHSTSHAWWDTGHMAVAWVAYQKLTPEKKARVAKLLAKNPYFKKKWAAMIPSGTPADQRNLMMFMIAATWPDEIKGDNAYVSDGPDNGDRPPAGPSASQNKGYSDHARHKYWHFTDTPFTRDGTALPPIPDPNAGTQIEKFRQTLASKKSDKLKSYDLVWLLHLVGDVHQPLHSATRVSAGDLQGDAGGNFVKLASPNRELHAFWDGLPGSGSQAAAISPAITYAQGLAPADPVLAQKANASDWIAESFQLAKDSVYIDPILTGDGPFSINDVYAEQARKAAAVRVALAGERLANLINNNLK